VGEGPDRAVLEATAAELGVSNRLRLVGWSDDPRAFLPTFDVFVLPSINEGFPLVVLEAMLAGLPVVATAVGSTAEAVEDGETGFIVAPGDVRALVSAIERLLASATLRRSLGEAGRARAERDFTARAMAVKYETLYDGIRRPSGHRTAGAG
jgi:glycosyltransferase involved in cell wall biosynthesis